MTETDNPLAELDGGGQATRTGTIVVDFGGASDVPNNLNNPNQSLAFSAAGLNGLLFNLDGVPITFALQGQNLVGSVGNDEYIIISVTGAVLGPDGHTVTYTYQVELLRAIEHGGTSLEDTEILSNVQFVVTDGNGSTANGSVDVTIYDDVIERNPLLPDGESETFRPIINDFVQEDGMTGAAGGDSSTGIGPSGVDSDETGGNAGALNTLFSAGADSPMTLGLSLSESDLPALLSKGAPVGYAISDIVGGQVLTATADGRVVFTLTVNENGSWAFDLKDQLDHVANNGDTGTTLRLVGGDELAGGIDFSSIITASDADADTIVGATPGAFVVRVENDVPAFTREGGVNANVAEDGLKIADGDLSTGNPDATRPGDAAGTSDETTISFASVASYLLPGADENLTLGLADNLSGPVTLAGSNTAVTSKGAAVLWGNDGSVVVAYVNLTGGAGYQLGDRIIFTVTLDSANDQYKIDLQDQIDHENLVNNPDNFTLALNLAPALTAVDYDGDAVNFGTANITLTVENDIPILTAFPPDSSEETIVKTETLVFDLKGGNTTVGGIVTGSFKGVIITGDSLNGGQDTANTSANSIGIGNGQSIDGQGTQGQNTIGPEILTLNFHENVVVPNGNVDPTFGASYNVNTFRFSIDAAEAQQNDDGVVFVSVLDGGVAVSPNAYTLTINDAAPGLPIVAHDVYNGVTLIGRVYENVPDDADFVIFSAAGFDSVKIGNYNGFAFASDSGGGMTTLTSGNGFKVYGVEADIVTTTIVTVVETFKIGHDETAGINTTPDPNAADDVSGAGAPSGISTYGDKGFAMSSASVIGLFDPKVGADEDGTWTFKITDKIGGEINNVDSGLQTLDGSAIHLFTDGNVILGKTGSTVVFAVTIDADGKVWVAQDLAIKHGVVGSSAFAHDDIVSIIGKLYVNATLTDADGDFASATSQVALQIDFQDAGPQAFDNSNSVAEGSSVSGDVVLDDT